MNLNQANKLEIVHVFGMFWLFMVQKNVAKDQ